MWQTYPPDHVFRAGTIALRLNSMTLLPVGQGQAGFIKGESLKIFLTKLSDS